jgi:GrpB-like predicted nucleotidyltransferase (UPF0157 family)
MLTNKQKQWISTLSDVDIIHIYPFDDKAELIFQSVRTKLLQFLGVGALIEHRGSTRLGISGQDEIDVYIPTKEKLFNSNVAIMASFVGAPKSIYPNVRARFLYTLMGKKIDLFVINDHDEDWLLLNKFEEYLLANPKYLSKYNQLKTKCNGLSVRAYYQRKSEFINRILDRPRND